MPHGEEPIVIVKNDEVFYQMGDLMIPARPDSGIDERLGPCGPGAKPYYEGKGEDAKKENQREHDPMEGKCDKFSGTDLGALERDLLKYDFNEAEHGGANETLILMTPSSFLSPTKEPSASLSPVEPLSLMEAQQKKTRLSCSANLLEGGGLMSHCEWLSWASCQRKNGNGINADLRGRLEKCGLG